MFLYDYACFSEALNVVIEFVDMFGMKKMSFSFINLLIFFLIHSFSIDMDFFLFCVGMCILIVQSCRLQAEQEKLQKIGPLAYYSEWVKAWKRDTSREAVQKHFEETGEDENTQLIEMFMYQTDREYRIMMGTDYRIRRDPLAMRMQEDQIKQSTSFPLATSFISL